MVAERIYVVDGHPRALEVAYVLGAELCLPGAAPEGARVVVVASCARDVDAIVASAPAPDAVVGWDLPERSAISLLEAGIPVVHGIADLDALREAVAGWPAWRLADELSVSAQLSLVESELAEARPGA